MKGAQNGNRMRSEQIWRCRYCRGETDRRSWNLACWAEHMDRERGSSPACPTADDSTSIAPNIGAHGWSRWQPMHSAISAIDALSLNRLRQSALIARGLYSETSRDGQTTLPTLGRYLVRHASVFFPSRDDGENPREGASEGGACLMHTEEGAT